MALKPGTVKRGKIRSNDGLEVGPNASPIEVIDENGVLVGATLEAGTVADSAEPGKPGQIKFDATNLYICVAEDSWKTITLEDIL